MLLNMAGSIQLPIPRWARQWEEGKSSLGTQFQTAGVNYPSAKNSPTPVTYDLLARRQDYFHDCWRPKIWSTGELAEVIETVQKH